MHLEIERRFLINKNYFILPNKKKSIKQAYLLFDDNQVLRVRKINTNFLITYKYQLSDLFKYFNSKTKAIKKLKVKMEGIDYNYFKWN